MIRITLAPGGAEIHNLVVVAFDPTLAGYTASTSTALSARRTKPAPSARAAG